MMINDVIMELYITRHGETWNNLSDDEKALMDGMPTNELRQDPSLTPKGREQARLLGERLSECRFDAIFSSPLLRAVDTAHEIAVSQTDKRIELLPELVEYGTLGYAGHPIIELKKSYPDVSLHMETPTPTGGNTIITEPEDDARVVLRARRCIDYIRDRFKNGERVLVIAHGTYNNFLIAAALGLDNNTFDFCQENTGLTKIKYYTQGVNHWGDARLSYANDTSHLAQVMPGITFTL